MSNFDGANHVLDYYCILGNPISGLESGSDNFNCHDLPDFVSDCVEAKHCKTMHVGPKMEEREREKNVCMYMCIYI